MIFNDQKKSKYFSKYKGSKLESSMGSLWKALTKKAKLDNFIRNLSPTVFKQSSFNFHSLIFIKLQNEFI